MTNRSAGSITAVIGSTAQPGLRRHSHSILLGRHHEISAAVASGCADPVEVARGVPVVIGERQLADDLVSLFAERREKALGAGRSPATATTRLPAGEDEPSGRSDS